jgi:predicted nucleotidyltransferase
VSWPKRHSLFDRIRLKRELESLLQNKVDLVTEKSLYPRIREEVMRSAKPL